ncbi:uncharacterized protein LOC126368681 isoform X3 [Pectinophora gossypiella]|nr:uncharacterized protein LOC126368681 isoform X3 [Pectinophora gossypiella]
MMGMLWVVLFVALTGAPLGQGLPLRSTPQAYPHDTSGDSLVEAWGSTGGLYAALPALALVITAIGFLFGCTWCYRHKDCKPNEGADNQLFTASATHLHDARRQPAPDSGFSEPVNNNISEDNNNGPISLREMQNIANNNAAAYIVSENEERNRVSRESVVEFEPLPSGIRAVDPLEHCADWFGGEDLPRNRLQYLREIGRGWFGRVVEGEIEDEGATSTVAVKILNQNASLEDKARFLDEAKIYRDVTHENILAFIAKCLQEDPWILMFELCSMDLQQYLIQNRPKMAILNEGGVPLQLMCDVTSALAHLHSRGYLYGNVSSTTVLVRSPTGSAPRAVLGSYVTAETPHEFTAPETRRHPPLHTMSSEVWSLGTLIWEVCAWGAGVPPQQPPPPDLPCPYRDHLYQVMQLCWNPTAESRPTSAQVQALLNHLHTTHATAHSANDAAPDHGYGSSDFEERWQRLKPNTIPKIDEHVALVHAPSTSMASHFTGSEEFDNAPTTQDTLSVDMDTAVSRSSSIMSDKDPLSVQIKSESLTNLHGSLEDVRNIYLTHNETALLECHQGNISLEEREKEQDRSDSSVDPWVKDLIAGSQDDVSYYKDVSDVIKNLDNILNSEKTSSSESSHQASPSRDNLSLDCKKDYPVQSSMVKSPGITNFQNILELGFNAQPEEPCDEDEEVDRETIGTLSHSFERHSDTLSQHTLENLTPDTPIKDMDIVSKIEDERKETNASTETTRHDTELPKEKIDSSDKKLPKLKDLCVVSLSSVSETNEQLNVREDCETSCDSNLDEIVRTQVKPKSIDNTVQNDQEKSIVEAIEGKLIQESEATKENNIDELIEEKGEELNNVENVILPNVVNDIAVNLLENEVIQPAVEIVSKILQENENAVQKELPPELGLREINRTEIVAIASNDNLKEITNALIDEERKVFCEPENKHEIKVESLPSLDKQEDSSSSPRNTPEPVQIIDKEEHTEPTQNIDTEKAETAENYKVTRAPVLPSETVQNVAQEEIEEKNVVKDTEIIEVEDNATSNIVATKAQSNDSTAYMDLINYTSSEIDNNSEILQDSNVKKIIQSCLDQPDKDTNCSIIRNESTVYLDLPSMLKDTHDFLHSERITSQIVESNDVICASTPKGSECSADNILEGSVKENENSDLSVTKIPDDATVKSEQKFVADILSPFDSPTKSHPTDTYDENSSVVLGPFENCTIEYKGVKTEVDLPKEELLAFSSNFSEINLETPSPLRDGNFLNEVPDIVPDDLQFDDLTLSEAKKEVLTDNTDETDKSGTTKHVSPSTPPNSPGIYLASTSQQKYLVDIDLEPPEPSYPPIETDSGLSSLQKEIDLNQIELQITTKLAMAENENNLNIEYSGPLTVEGLVSEEDAVLRESDAMPEAFLAGNGGSVEDNCGFSLDEECVKALRNELELKLPLAQVAGIEPAEAEWGELPPPPELVLSYSAAPPALSPIAEETRHQLSAYENDAWNTSNRTDSSESYPEPCNDSTAEVTDLPTGAVGSNDHSTYTILSKESKHDTYTIQKDIPTSKEATMSADSLNGSPYKKPKAPSPIDDRTYNKNEDEKVSNCERISQVSPFLMSPTTETSAPDSVDNATGVSTLSKTTLPTDAKHSKPSECLSKATSIDSWCSNDTLYNVEENFDDLVMDADIAEFENERPELMKSASTETLTRNDEEKEHSHCSTYIVHDSKSEACETFSPDSITANDNYTYTKAKTELAGATPSVLTKSEVNDSTKNTTKDLAYGTLPSYSNCTTELVSGIDEHWRFQQPELVRRSPIADQAIFTPPRFTEIKESLPNDSPQITTEPVKKMDSIDITCLQDDINSHKSESSDSQILIDIESPQCNYRNDMAPSVTSTPLTEAVIEDDNVEVIHMQLPEESESAESLINSIPNFQTFLQSAEIRPQDISSASCEQLNSQDTGLLLEGESRTLSRDSNRDSMVVSDRTPTYSDFESSAVMKPQELNSRDKSSQSMESGMSSGDFRQFENSVRACPQDLSSLIDASSLFLTNERKVSEVEPNNESDQNSQPRRSVESIQTVDASSPVITNLIESHHLIPNITYNMVVTDLDEEETDQPHSIIITEVPQAPKEFKNKEVTLCKGVEPPKEAVEELKESPNRTFDSHTEINNLNHTYDSHTVVSPVISSQETSKPETKVNDREPRVNGVDDATKEIKHHAEKSPKTEIKETKIQTDSEKELPNGSVTGLAKEITCNGNGQNYATVHFLNETFEELLESNVDDSKNVKLPEPSLEETSAIELESPDVKGDEKTHENNVEKVSDLVNGVEDKVIPVTEDFLQNEKKFCTLDSYFPLLSDIRFTGPATEIMSTSFTQDSPTEPVSPECEQDNKPDAAADIVKEWDSDSESHSSNSSSGEFIWKDGDGHETAVVPTTHFDHQQKGGSQPSAPPPGDAAPSGAASEGSADSGSGSEGDEVEFVPSSWDCRAAPAKSSLRSLEQAPPTDGKKRVVFKRQKYHCVYEYPRELTEVDTHSPAYLPDLSTYCEWDPSSAEEAELGYGQLYGAPMDMYQLRSGIAFDYDEDFFISSSARPFESLGIMSTTSQFFPGMHVKPQLLEHDLDDADDFPPPPSPLAPTALTQTRTPSLDFTTPDSGVEDFTPGSTTTEEDFKTKKIPESEVSQCWKPIDSGSSSESVSPSSPGGEALGGLRHTRDKLKLDLPPSPHIPSPRHNRVFNFVLDKPKRHRIPDERPAETPLVMTDETPIVTTSLAIQKDAEDVTVPEPTFSTFGKGHANQKNVEPENSDQKIILTDEIEEETAEVKEESPVKVEAVKGEGTVLDSGDEDSGIESSSKATLERKTPNVS